MRNTSIQTIFISLLLLESCVSLCMNHSPKLLDPGKASVSIGVNSGGDFNETNSYSYQHGISLEGFTMLRFGIIEPLDIGIKIFGGVISSFDFQIGAATDFKIKMLDYNQLLLSGDIELSAVSYNQYLMYTANPNKYNSHILFSIKPAILFGTEFLYTGLRIWYTFGNSAIIPEILIGSSILDNPKLIIEGNLIFPSSGYIDNGFGATYGICLQFKI